MQTETVLRQALGERIRPVMTVSAVDDWSSAEHASGRASCSQRGRGLQQLLGTYRRWAALLVWSALSGPVRASDRLSVLSCSLLCTADFS